MGQKIDKHQKISHKYSLRITRERTGFIYEVDTSNNINQTNSYENNKQFFISF